MSEVGTPELLLFQYGSNMFAERLRQRIEEHQDHVPHRTHSEVRLLGSARLCGWSLALNLWSARGKSRVANMVEDETGEVWGALYELPSELVNRCDGKRSVLDRIEGHRTTADPENYAKICITVDLVGESKVAWTYIGLREASLRCEREHPDAGCSVAYRDAVIGGAKAIGLPPDYLDSLRELLNGS
jgi:gamma-glutamylcyclotransferase (GGCT)/AIG2-like uncharacterized protein YtfP